MGTKIGDPLSPAALRDDVRSIFGLGFFDDVQVRTEEFEGGVRVIFAVVERPLLREVGFEGNSELTNDELREKAAIRVGVLYNPVEVQKAEEAIRQKYEDEGYFGVQITPRTERTPEGDLRVVFRIEEGPKLYIDRIVIEGNKALTAGQIKDAMSTKERIYWIFPFSTVQRKVFDDDVDRILQVYADHGYIQARVESTEIVPDLARKKVTLRVRVVEGPQFRTGTITITGNELLSTEEVRKLVKLQEGEVFNRGALRNSVRALVDRYSELGRARAEVEPRTSNDLANLKVDVIIPIVEGGPVYVERINITGNTKSSEKVLRRELRVAEGELFTFQKLVRSRQRLFNLGFFDEVNVNTEQGSTPDKIVVNIDVKERATGVFSIGAGYSSLDSLFATLDISQRNLFGRGQEVFLRFRIGTQSRLGLVGFTEPYLFDIPLRAGFDIYDREREYDDFTEERLGGDIRASYPLAEYLTLVRPLPAGERRHHERVAHGERGPQEPRGDESQLGDRVLAGPRLPRQHLRADPGQPQLAGVHVRGAGRRHAVLQGHRRVRRGSSRCPCSTWCGRCAGSSGWPRAGAARKSRSSSGSSSAAPPRSAASGRAPWPRRTGRARSSAVTRSSCSTPSS